MSGTETEAVTAGRGLGAPPDSDARGDGDGDGEIWCLGPHEAPDLYELLGTGLRGGEGTTWRARYTGRLASPLPRAVKVLARPASAAAGWPSADDEQAWRDQLALRQHHECEHLVRLFGVFPARAPHLVGQVARAADVVVVDMEFVPGLTLSALVREAPTTRAAVVERLKALVGVCEGLAALHSVEASSGNPAVHRDVTPANCVVHPQRGGVLLDLTTLQLALDDGDPAGRHTPGYSAPEVLADARAPRLPSADVYAVGALAAFCLLGESPPADPDEAASRVRAACRRLGLPGSVAELVLAPLAADPARRPVEVEQWAQRLVRQASRPVRRRRLVIGSSAAALAVAAGVVVVLVAPGDEGGGSAAVPGAAVRGSIDSPADGATVPDCSRFTGTATAGGEGRALVLASRNLVNRDPIHYVEPVVGYDRPRASASWTGSFWFNENAVGQSFEVSLVDVDLGGLQTSLAAKDPVAQDAVVLAGKSLDSVVLTRGPGADGATDCLLEEAYSADDAAGDGS